MASTYTNDLRLELIATGEAAATWGDKTNTNLTNIAAAFGYATQDGFAANADSTTTVADGAADPARAMYFKVTSSATLTATRTLTIAPNTISRVMWIENATTGGQSIAISQGTGANVTIATGKTAVVYLDGAGSGAAVVDAMAGVDPGVTDTLAEVLAAGNTTTTDQKIQFRDSAIYINSSADGQLDLVADTEIQIAATTVDLNGNLDISGTATGASSFATAAGGTFTTAAGNDLNIVYPDGRSLFFKEAGTTTLTLDNVQGATFAGAVDMASTLIVATSTTTPFISLGGTSNSYQTVTGSADGNDVTYRSYQNHIFKNVTGASSSTDGTERMRIDSSGNVGIGCSPLDALHIASAVSTDYRGNVFLQDTTSMAAGVGGQLTFGGNYTSSGVATEWSAIQGTKSNSSDDYSGQIEFKTRKQGYALETKMTIDSSGNLLVGTTSADGRLKVSAASGVSAVGSIALYGNNGSAYGGSNVVRSKIESKTDGTAFGANMLFYTNDTSNAYQERMRIDSDGNVGIGTSSPAFNLTTQGSSGTVTVASKNTGGNASVYIEASNTNTAKLELAEAGTGSYSLQVGNDDALMFFDDSSERMRIDASGDLIVGGTSSGANDAVSLSNTGYIQAIVNGDTVGYFNRRTSDGEILRFQKDGSTVGSIGTSGNDLTVGTGDTGLYFYDGADTVIPWNISSNSARNGSIDLGASSHRFKDLYLSGGAYLGGTAAANKLDDYEEGDYDCTVTCSTSGTVTLNTLYNRAGYTKVGRLVTVHGFIVVSSVSSPVGYFKISLPFAAANLTNRAGDSTATLVAQNVASANVADFVASVNEGSAEIIVQLGDSTAVQNDSAQELQANTYISFSTTYSAA